MGPPGWGQGRWCCAAAGSPGRWRGSAKPLTGAGLQPPAPSHIDMYIIQSYPEQHNTLKKIYSYIQYL